MSKTKVKSSKKQEKDLLPKKYQNLIFISLMVVLVFVYFAPAIQSEGGFGASDNIASMSFENYKKEAKENGEFPLWIPHIFSGMPSYQSLLLTGDRYWDIPPKIVFGFGEIVKSAFGSDIARIAFYYILYGIGFYLLLNYKGLDKYLSFILAFSAIFSTSIIVWVVIGHNTKPVVLSMLPFAFLGYEVLRNKMSLIWIVLLTIIIHIMLEGSHLQMIFYCGLTLGIYALMDLIGEIISKENFKGALRATLLLAFAGGIGFLMSADRYLSTLEYTPYSTRGSGPLLESESNSAKDEAGGNTYEYATAWSFSPTEVITFFVPSYFGYGFLEYDMDDPDKRNSTYGRIFGQNDSPPMTYWGQKESEDAPPYMGIIIISFALFGAITNFKKRFVKFLVVTSVIFLFLSFGDNLPILYDLFFYNFPNFNKFRAPSMSLAIVQFIMPLLAGYGFMTILRMKRNNSDIKSLKIFLYISLAFLVLGLLFMVGLKDFYQGNVNFNNFAGKNIGEYISQIPPQTLSQIEQEYKDFMFETTYKDWLINGALLSSIVFLCFLYVQNRVTKTLLVIGLLIATFADLWRVAYRKFDYKEEAIVENRFRNWDYIDFIKSDTDIFRISDYVLGSNSPAYYLLENVGGYHSAKLRIYQDLLDATSGGNTSSMNDPFMWSLLNVKYIIDSREYEGAPVAFKSKQLAANVMLNPNYLPRAFFVDSVAQIDNLELLKKLRRRESWNPIRLCYLEDLPTNKIDAPDSTAKVEITKKENHLIEMQVEASGNNLLYISEIYYEPGWRAFIDDEEVEILRANFGFRAVEVPKGKHILKMKFESESFEQGKSISFASNILLGFLLLAGIYLEMVKKRKNDK